MSRYTQATINLANIKSNFELANQWAPASKNMAVIKANAYGHGMVAVAQSLASIVPAFAVAIFDEAVVLRKASIDKNILILQGVYSVDELSYASKNDLWITIHNRFQLDLLLNNPQENAIKVWLKLDTGMHRLGLEQEEFVSALTSIIDCTWVDRNLVISSHFSCASEFDNNESTRQLNQFRQMLRGAKVINDSDEATFLGDLNIQLSLANSPAIANLPEANLDWNRPGILLYGLPLFDIAHKSDQQLKPSMTFESNIIAIRDVKKGEFVGYGKKWQAERPSIIATVAVGYADGYPRQAKNGTPLLVNGQKASLAGVVSMDLISIDVTEISTVKVGDKVELWGENICVNEVAGFAGTIGYDLITGVSKRVPRIYIE